MQYSATRIFIFVEGRRTDSFFYGALCGPICEAAGLSYEVVIAERLGAGGGKGALIRFYELLEAAGSLIDRVSGTAKGAMFYLDKDVDDILNRLVHSSHVQYQDFYSVENALFIHGDIVTAASAASSIDPALLRARIPAPNSWLRAAAERWKDFVAFCLFAHKYGVGCDCNYGRMDSPFNDPPESPSDLDTVATARAELETLLGLQSQVFDRKLRAVYRLVDRLYRTGRQDAVFNGKWYRILLEREIDLASAGSPYQRFGLSNGILTALAASIDFSGAWTGRHREGIVWLTAALASASLSP